MAEVDAQLASLGEVEERLRAFHAAADIGPLAVQLNFVDQRPLGTGGHLLGPDFETQRDLPPTIGHALAGFNNWRKRMPNERYGVYPDGYIKWLKLTGLSVEDARLPEIAKVVTDDETAAITSDRAGARTVSYRLGPNIFLRFGEWVNNKGDRPKAVSVSFRLPSIYTPTFEAVDEPDNSPPGSTLL